LARSESIAAVHSETETETGTTDILQNRHLNASIAMQSVHVQILQQTIHVRLCSKNCNIFYNEHHVLQQYIPSHNGRKFARALVGIFTYG